MPNSSSDRYVYTNDDTGMRIDVTDMVKPKATVKSNSNNWVPENPYELALGMTASGVTSGNAVILKVAPNGQTYVDIAKENVSKYNRSQLAQGTVSFEDSASGLTSAAALPIGESSGIISAIMQNGKDKADIDISSLKRQLEEAKLAMGSTNSSLTMAQIELITHIQKNSNLSDEELKDSTIIKIEELSKSYGSLSDSDLESLMATQELYTANRRIENNPTENPEEKKFADKSLEALKDTYNRQMENYQANAKTVKDLEKLIANTEEAKQKNDNIIQNVSVYPESTEGILAGPPFMKMITDKSPEEEKAQLADFKNEMSEGYIGAKNGTFLKYLENPNFYTNSAGRIFVDSSNSHDLLTKFNDDPQKQKDHVQAAQDILGDPEKSYEVDPSNPKFKSPNDKVLTLGNRKFGLPASAEYSDKQKSIIKEWEENKLVTSQAQDAQKDQPKPETPPKPPEETEPPETYLPPDNYNKKQFMQIANHDKVPYVRVNGYNKIRFPNVWSGRYAIDLMGLPPTRVQRDKEVPAISKNAFDLVAVDAEEVVPGMYIYDEDEQLKKSFLKLTIHPIDIESIYGMNGERLTEDQVNKNKKKYLNKSAVLTEIEYNFAVQANSQITYSHQNNYAASGIEQLAGGMFGSIADTINQTSSLSQVGGGAAGGLFNSAAALGNKLASSGQKLVSNSLETLTKSVPKDWDQASKDTASMFLGAFKNLGDVALSRLAGGRIDLPDVWTDSQTNIQHSFTLEFRTMNPDPLSDQYFKDIILPVYILLTLSLPTDTKGIVYKTPPYISCNLDQLFEIRIGAITSISIDPHLDEVNFKRAPRHVTVQITIKDLYSVMKQKAYDADNDDKGIGDENEDTVTKDKFINNFVKYAESLDKKKTPVTNEAYYLTEFARIPAYMMALEKYKLEQAAKNLSKLNLASVNASTSSKTPNNPVSSDTAKLAQSLANNVTKSAQILKDAKGKTSFITSIGNAITGVTNGVKNIMAGVQSAIQPVRNLINTGKLVMNSVNGLKNSVKLIGQTANLEGILNGQFASSVGFAFSNVANATGVVDAISDACAGGGSFKTIMKNLGQVPERVLTNNLANAVTDSGSLNLSNQIRNAACTWYGLANMFGQTYPNVVGLKDLTSRGSDITSIATVLFDNLGGIANGLNSFTTGQSVGSTSGNTTQVDPLLSQYVSATLKGATAKGVITAGEASSNQKVQSELAEATQVAKEQLTATPDVVVKLEGAYAEAINEAKKSYGEGNKARAAAFMQAVSDQIPPEELKTTVDQLEKNFEVYLATAKNNEKEARQLALTEILEKG